MFAGYRHCKKCGKALMGLFDGALCEECEKEENSRMTNEEAIANINMIRVAFVDPVTKEQRKLIDDTLDTAIKALEQTTWIPVSERLPEDEQEILFSTKTGRVHSGKYHDDDSANQWYSHKDKCRAWNNIVSAWMPLPKPYEPQESEDKE